MKKETDESKKGIRRAYMAALIVIASALAVTITGCKSETAHEQKTHQTATEEAAEPQKETKELCSKAEKKQDERGQEITEAELQALCDELTAKVEERKAYIVDLEGRSGIALESITALRKLDTKATLTEEERSKIVVKVEKINVICPALAMEIDPATGHLTSDSAAVLSSGHADSMIAQMLTEALNQVTEETNADRALLEAAIAQYEAQQKGKGEAGR